MSQRKTDKFKVYNTEKMQKERASKVRLVRKFNKHRLLGFIVIAFFVIYLSFAFTKFVFTEEMPYISVESGEIKDITSAKGIITRSETLVNAETAGYVEYLYIEGEKVPAKSVIARISSNPTEGLLEAKINNVEQEIISSSESINTDTYNDEFKMVNKDIRQLLRQYVSKQDNNPLSQMYNTKDGITRLLKQRYETYIVENNKEIHRLLGSKQGYEKQLNATQQFAMTPASGIISYRYDGYENLHSEDITGDTFKDFEVTSNTISLEPHSVDTESTLFKLVDSFDWYVTILMDNIKQYEMGATVDLKIQGHSPLQGTVVKTTPSGKKFLVTVLCNQRVHEFMNQRMVDVILEEKLVEGLKLPNSAISSHELVGVPKTYMTDSNGRVGVVMKGVDKDRFVAVPIVYADENYVYVEKTSEQDNTDDYIGIGDIIVGEAGKNMPDHKISQLISIPGVYVINKGYKEFRTIESLYTNNEYTIVSNSSNFGIRLFDRVLLNKGE